ncbi:hypothetical protein JAO71_03755 [Olleya sp. YSTF-M6]|uniref:Uncharacterized protein n=1 Tax=Olleya sediminilitoris TaxID=2795739 RepID=A0ABS1WIF5_9FLAO|nr:hypothetical protein [Olleya sediminilitoris]MBL7558910.1 hypothetical protein [Olleya sediminilitoris]
MVKDFTRPITHWSYKNPDKLKKYYHRVEKKIYVKPRNSVDSKYHWFLNYYMDNNFIHYPTKGTFGPVLYALVSFAFFLVFVWPSDEKLKGTDYFFMILTLILTLFFLIYLFTKPKKEQILNRRDGLITMTGFFWQKNITMTFETCEFAYSTGGEDGMGAFLLEIIRPNNWQTFDPFGYGGAECYESMSFTTWYMDKNRPLPPGEAFDRFREQDFERRKAEGFPKPLYPSKIKTPEATKSQQAERKRIGGW